MKTPIKILLIEDDPDDVELLEDSLKDYNVRYKMNVINDGGLVSNYLLEDTELPDIIVLDLNLPRVHGREILKKIKVTPSYKDIPLLILTTSSTKEDMEYSYQHGANRFIKKPTTMEGIKSAVATILELANKSLDTQTSIN